MIRKRKGTEGFTLLEVLGAISLFTMASLGFVGVVLSARSLQEETRARTQAIQLARRVVEAMQATPLEEVFSSFNADPSDDPDGINTAIGALFNRHIFNRTFPSHASLTAPPPVGAQDYPFSARIEFPVQGNELRENLTNSRWPQIDLDGDGQIDALNKATEYVVLPLVVTVEWQTRKGTRTLDLRAILGRRES